MQDCPFFLEFYFFPKNRANIGQFKQQLRLQYTYKNIDAPQKNLTPRDEKSIQDEFRKDLKEALTSIFFEKVESAESGIWMIFL